jgi:malonyl-CoA/methylmalonyl-CoA synthetase
MAQQANIDRSRLVSQHTGDHVLPNSPLFGKLIRHARRDRLALRDRGLGIEKSYVELLDAVLALRKVVERHLSPDVRAKLRRGEEVYMGVLAAGGWEFTVAILTVLALGAAAVPMCEYSPTTLKRFG